MKTLRFLILPIVLSILGGSGLLWAQGAPSGIPQSLRIRTLGINSAPPTVSGYYVAAANVDTAASPQVVISNSTAGCTADLCSAMSITNLTDADLQIKVTDVGAAIKFAQIGPNSNIPFKFASRATTQEMLKTSAITVTGATGATIRAYNSTSATRTGVGTYTVNNTLANFTATPNCVCTGALSQIVCVAGATSATNANVTVVNIVGAATDADFSLTCNGP